MWDLPRPGLEPVSPALAGRLLTTAPPGKPLSYIIIINKFLPFKVFTNSLKLNTCHFVLFFSVTCIILAEAVTFDTDISIMDPQ